MLFLKAILLESFELSKRYFSKICFEKTNLFIMFEQNYNPQFYAHYSCHVHFGRKMRSFGTQ